MTAAGDVTLVPTPGHALGHLSCIVEDGEHTVFLAGDTPYVSLERDIYQRVTPIRRNASPSDVCYRLTPLLRRSRYEGAERSFSMTPLQYSRVVVRRTGGPEVLEVVEEDLPEPGVGQARVKILAADVSFSDVNLRRGRYPGAPKPPFTPGYAMVGLVDQLGPQTAGLALGQRVAAVTFYGSYSQYLCLPAQALIPIPEDVDPAEAVSLVFNYAVAYQMLHRIAHVARGQRVLIHGAAGGVGSALVELGHLVDLEMYGTASKPKHELVARLGATPIDYQTEDFVARVAALTGGRGVDAVFDPMGAAHLRQSARTVRAGGTIVGYGYYATANRGGGAVLDVVSQYVWMALWSLPPNRKRGVFYDIRPLMKAHPEWYREDLKALFDLLVGGKLHPVIAARLPLSEAPRAHQLVERAQVQGKITLIPNA